MNTPDRNRVILSAALLVCSGCAMEDEPYEETPASDAAAPQTHSQDADQVLKFMQAEKALQETAREVKSAPPPAAQAWPEATRSRFEITS